MTENITTVFLGAGSNLGHRQRNILSAIALINTKPETSVLRCSPIYPTPPLSDESQPEYLNTIIEIETALEPRQLLNELKDIENSLGRQEKEKWQSRLIDLDIIFYGSRVVNEPGLVIPHSQAHLRSFVLEGICRLEPDKMHPILGRTCKELKDRLGGGNFFIDDKEPLLIEISGPIGVGKTTVATGLAERFGGVLLKEKYDENPYLPLVYEGRDELALKSELFFLNNSISEMKKDGLRRDTVYVADYIFEKSAVYPKLWLKDDDFRIFEQTYNLAKEQVAAPVLVIDIFDTVDNCLERIHSRRRKYEQDITAEFLSVLVVEYEKILENWDKSPVIRIDAGSCDFRQAQCLDRLFDEVRWYVKGTRDKG
jgi:deoxyguanosine kinase